ncbi:MAG: hypothetical protein COU22_03050 [Candidatus Komeilibacteria bacterium CG10_big_fil_rev_8_21_14_0_10_41_13]|uniref:DUF86 domain-containing protein n=1 Tax=Candidatus Komeilibacteria bacterium CG10_big_fil_rev_8_21_14_0_10_41_13 TaxID=1974476 RepID=A0A2M6WBW6_9BACT|nr:MAG: hypothetical protein COU22_03050 [Candidatus Komeilibacteria bacterium CG10_big_fil_rev_8_21_14_0_10_41_13]
MFKRHPELFLEDIIESIKLIEKYSKGLDYAKFMRSTDSQDAVVRRLEIIAEACKNLPKEIKADYPEVPWRKINGIRNRIAHEYFGIDEKIVWQTVKEDLPEFKKQILKISKDLSK